MDGEELLRCPRRPLLEDPEFFSELFWNYKAFQRGFLPNAGGLEDQPVMLMDSFRVLEQALDLCEAQKREKEARRSRRAAAQGRK